MQKELAQYLKPLQLEAWQYHPVVGSTNDIALDWAKSGAPDWGLVIADKQTKGRGRKDRFWVTLPGAALAFSMVLRPTLHEKKVLSRFTALAALGLIRVLSDLGLKSEIKWPNDVILNGKKVAGVLVETDWQENQLKALVTGMGVNVNAQAVPGHNMLRYPATSLEEVLGAPINRWELLSSVIQEMMNLRPSLCQPGFVKDWNTHLAFRGDVMPILFPDNIIKEMEVLGVMADGRLELRNEHGEKLALAAGEIVMEN